MKSIIYNRSYLNAFILLMLLSQCTVVYMSFSSFDFMQENIELCELEDMESEEDTKKEKDDKFQEHIMSYKGSSSMLNQIINHSDNLYSLHHPEVSNPPPD